MKINWVTKHNGVGSCFGYTNYERKLIEALEIAGIELSDSAEICVHLTPPYFFQPIRFKKNILITMFEFRPLPEKWGLSIMQADMVLVPCRHNQELFQEVTERPVEVCREGVDLKLFPFYERKKSKPFVFLYVGDENHRKGIWHVSKAWEIWNERYPEYAEDSILIMKMTKTGEKQELKQITKNAYIDYRVLPYTVRDSIKYDKPIMSSLYHYANCFLFPSMGEGFGLTLAEAMATGLPCIYTPYSGPVDFISEREGYPIRYGFKKLELKDQFGEAIAEGEAADPDIDSIVERMHEVFMKYDVALEKGQLASERIKNNFTWDKSAADFMANINKHFSAVA